MLRRLIGRLRRELRYGFRGGLKRDIAAVLAPKLRHGVDVLFYCQFPFHEGWIRTTVADLEEAGVSYAVIVDHAAQPLETLPAEKQVLCSQRVLSRFSCKVFVTAVSGMTRRQMPNTATTIHMPHSLASLHMIYPDGAFDAYDQIFACGDHHVAEIEQLQRLRPSFRGRAVTIGYGKTDWLVEEPRKESNDETSLVVIAPSWGADNLFDRVGVPLISELLDLNLRVVCRPHPSFFVFGSRILSEFESQFGDNDRFQIEKSDATDISFLSADVLISDYSGIALEYAFVTGRPVVFADLPAKVLNPGWQSVGRDPVELGLRSQLGRVVEPDARKIAVAVSELLRTGSEERARIEALRDAHNHNFRACGATAARAIEELLG